MFKPTRLLILGFLTFTMSNLPVTTYGSQMTCVLATTTMQDVAPAEIVFPSTNKLELPVQGHITIQAYVLDSHGNRLNADIDWNLADPDHEAFVLVGPNVNTAGVNSVELTWLGGRADLCCHPPGLHSR